MTYVITSHPRPASIFLARMGAGADRDHSWAYGADWRNFHAAIERARATCSNSGGDPVSNFVGATKITGTKPAHDVHLSRYAAYLVAMNGDPRKSEVAAAQTYFALPAVATCLAMS